MTQLELKNKKDVLARLLEMAQSEILTIVINEKQQTDETKILSELNMRISSAFAKLSEIRN